MKSLKSFFVNLYNCNSNKKQLDHLTQVNSDLSNKLIESQKVVIKASQIVVEKNKQITQLKNDVLLLTTKIELNNLK